VSLDDPGLTCPVCDWPYPKCHCDEIERKEAMNMDKPMLTSRKIEALVAAYCGERPTCRLVDYYGNGLHWRGTIHMGGAVQRMVQELRDLGYLTGCQRHSFEPQKSNELTVKGYDAIRTYVGPKSKFFRLIDFAQLKERRADRARFEAARAVRFVQHQEREKAERSERVAKAKAERTLMLRSVLADYADMAFTDWTDDELLDFADRIASI
jgi:hypothetical protein